MRGEWRIHPLFIAQQQRVAGGMHAPSMLTWAGSVCSSTHPEAGLAWTERIRTYAKPSGLGAKPKTVRTYGKAKQQRHGGFA
jgi:hypothetical protein